jgi:hypothetical protein
MSLSNAKPKVYVNIAEGKFAIKNYKTNERELYDNLTGRLVKVEIKDESYQGKTYKKAYFDIADNIDTYTLGLRVNSGYFRTFVNSLKSGNVNKIITISAVVNERNGKSNSVIFVKQDGKVLKHFHTKDNMGDLPPVEQIVFQGQINYDNTKAMEYWIKWLESLKFETYNEEVAKKEIINDDFEQLDMDEDLPF